MSRAAQPIRSLLTNTFAATHVDALLRHFAAMTAEFQQSAWEEATVKGGKFIEAVLKAQWLAAGKPLPPARKFKAGNITRDLMAMPAGTLADSLRITIPRACEFVYDIASNRGARHDPSEVDPNEIDATVVLATCSWILAELVRRSQRGLATTGRVNELLASLSRRRYPLIEEVDGRVYFHLPGLSARQVALLSLWHRYPRRATKDELLSSIRRHGFSQENARKAVARLGRVVDEEPSGAVKLLLPGLSEAESLMHRDFSLSKHRS